MSTRASKNGSALVRREADAEERIVGEALRHIQTISRRAVVEGTAEIGDYLVATFFGGDLELAGSNSPTKPQALSRLLDQAHLIDMSASFLRRAIRFSVQYRALPASVRD